MFFEKLQDFGKKISELTNEKQNQGAQIVQFHSKLEMKEKILQENEQVFQIPPKKVKKQITYILKNM